MNRPDHDTYREWLNLDVDGSLPRERRAQLDQHLASCSACRSEREALLALAGVLERSRVEVRPGFRHQVVSSLPAASWESRSPRTWSFPAAVCLLLGAVAAVLMGGGAAGGSSVLATAAAVAGMLQATLLAGAGLLAATWKGLGLLFEQVISSPVSLGVFGVFVLCLNLLLVSLLRRRRPALDAAREAASRDTGSSGR